VLFRSAIDKIRIAEERAKARRKDGKESDRELVAVQEEVRRRKELARRQNRIVGQWESGYSHIVRLMGSEPAKMDYEDSVEFCPDGTFRKTSRDKVQSRVMTEQGTWKLSGETLTLKYDSGSWAGKTVAYSTVWTGENRFELRFADLNDYRTRLLGSGTAKCVSCYYDSVGVLHTQMQDSRFKNATYTVTKTPRWYERRTGH